MSPQKGFSLIEVLLAASLFSIIALALTSAYLYGSQSSAIAGYRNQATMLAEEGLEAARNVRDTSYANLVDGTYGLAVASNKWSLAGSSDVSGLFTRQITVATVSTTLKQVTSTITWAQNLQRNGTLSLTTYLTNAAAVIVGNWATPVRTSGVDLSGNNDGLDVKTNGNYAYVLRNDGTPDFAIINITSPASPTLVGSLALAGTPAKLQISGTYAFVTNSTDTSEVIVINISNPAAPAVVANVDLPGGGDGAGIVISGNFAYVTRVASTSPEFYIVDISTPTAPVVSGSVELTSTASRLYVNATHAFVASASDTQELQVISITTPAAPTLVGSLNMTGTQDMTAIAGFGNTLLMGRIDTNLYVINITTPTSPTLTTTWPAGGQLNDISLGNSNTYAFLATTDINNEFKVVNITTAASPVLLGVFNTTGSATTFGLYYDAAKDKAFITSNANGEELTIISPS